MIKSIAITDFLPPETVWPAPTLPMDLGPHVTALAQCAAGAMLAIAHMDARRMLNSLAAGSLWQALADVKARSEWAYLVLSDCPTPGRMAESKAPVLEFLDRTSGELEQRKWTWPAWVGALLTAQELGVCVMQIPTERDLGAAIGALGRRDRSTKRVSPIRAIEALAPAEALLLALPGVGEALMLRLLQETGGNAVAALMILTDSAYPFAGVGPKTRADVRQALGLRADEAVAFQMAQEAA